MADGTIGARNSSRDQFLESSVEGLRARSGPSKSVGVSLLLLSVLVSSRTEGTDAMLRIGTAVVLRVTFAVIVLGAVLEAQQPERSASKATFEVASVRPNISGDGGGGINLQPGGRFSALNIPLVWLIESAYGLGHYQLDGGPSWIHTERFDVIAKAETEIPKPLADALPGPFHFMLRALLAERFKLVVHHEKRQRPVYELHLSRSNGSLGRGLRKSGFDCATAERTVGGRLRPQNDGRPTCGMSMRGPNIAAHAITMSQLVTVIEAQVHRPVVDRTGLSGLFDVDFQWAVNGADTSKPSIFTALQEQLGLKLVSADGDVDVLIVDRAERPTPD
jgi:uncharacterized protein (TIGR03435 family)